MKKRTLILGLICVLAMLPQTTSANGVCNIQNGSADFITNLVKNNQLAVRNIKNQLPPIKRPVIGDPIGNIKVRTSGTYNTLRSQSIRTWNTVLQKSGKKGYASQLNYFFFYPIGNEIPYQIKRDYEILEQEYNNLEKLYKDVLSRNIKGTLSLGSICEGVEHCLRKDQTPADQIKAVDVMTDFLSNIAQILDIYRITVTDGDYKGDYKALLTDTKILQNMEQYYSPENTGGCTVEGGGFFERIGKAIASIRLTNQDSNKAIEEMKQAWADAALPGGSSSKKQKDSSETSALSQYADTNGFSPDQREEVLGNLDEFNNNNIWYQENNDPISNTFKSILSGAEEQLSAFDTYLSGSINELKNIPIIEIEEVQRNNNIDQEIKERINYLYTSQQLFATSQNTDLKNIQDNIIKIHTNMTNSITTLESTIPISEILCKAQGGGGKCKQD